MKLRRVAVGAGLVVVVLVAVAAYFLLTSLDAFEKEARLERCQLEIRRYRSIEIGQNFLINRNQVS